MRTVLATLLAALATTALAVESPEVLDASQALVPQPPWPAGDEAGMGNTQGAGTWLRCAWHMTQPDARVYELSHLRSNAAPRSPFGVPVETEYRPSFVLPGTRHGFNGEQMAGEPGAQGTQMDALGHFAHLPEPWDGEGEPPVDALRYYGGLAQSEVKPTPDSPLLRLGIDKVPPVVTSAVLLDARAHLGGGAPLRAGQLVTAADLEAMLEAQGLAERGILPGDVVYVYTGWSDHWRDPDDAGIYYTMGPGLSYDAAQWLGERAVVLVALDNPFTDPAGEGFIMGEGAPAEGTPPDLPWVIHHHNLTQSGVYQIQNARLDALAADRVWTSCTMILPLREQGAAGSPVRPIAIGAPAG
jgi:kynurenine formamidase